jgi:hypothetical protein
MIVVRIEPHTPGQQMPHSSARELSPIFGDGLIDQAAAVAD